MTMNWNQIESNWEYLKGNIQFQWAKLTDEDLDTINGKREELAEKIQETYGIHPSEAKKQVDEWQKNDLADPNDEDLDKQIYYASNLMQPNLMKPTEFEGNDSIQADTDSSPRDQLDVAGKAKGSKGRGDGANPDAGKSGEKNNGYPKSNPIPPDLDKQPRDSDNETPHEDKSLDQT